MSENFIFAYLGISVPLMINDVNIYYVIIGIIALVVSRFVSVAVVAFFVNPFKKEKIPLSHQLVMTMGGLRGAVAFYLALNVSSEYKHLIITTTISLILFTVIGMGSATPFFLKWLDKTFPQDSILNKETDEDKPLMTGDGNKNQFEDDQFYIDPRHSIGMFSRAENIEQNYLQKYLRKDGWAGAEDLYEGNNGVHMSIHNIEKRVTERLGDLSPNRKSNLVNKEMQNRIASSIKRKKEEESAKNLKDNSDI